MKPPQVSVIVNGYTEAGNSSFAEHLMRHYAAMPLMLKRQFELILIDDHSPVPISAPPGLPALNLRIFRIDDDIDWNQPGARNLGVIQARSYQVLLHDLGQSTPAATLEKVIALGDTQDTIYKFHRLAEDDQSILAEHPNTLLMARARFLKYFGYDEEFAGHYGREDSTFTRLQRRFGAKIKTVSRSYPMINRKRDEEYSYSRLNRDMSFNSRLMAEKLELGRVKNHACFSRKFLAFKFHLVSASSLSD